MNRPTVADHLVNLELLLDSAKAVADRNRELERENKRLLGKIRSQGAAKTRLRRKLSQS